MVIKKTKSHNLKPKRITILNKSNDMKLKLNFATLLFKDQDGLIHSGNLLCNPGNIDDPLRMDDFLACSGYAFDNIDCDLITTDTITCPKCIKRLKEFKKELNKLF